MRSSLQAPWMRSESQPGRVRRVDGVAELLVHLRDDAQVVGLRVRQRGGEKAVQYHAGVVRAQPDLAHISAAGAGAVDGFQLGGQVGHR